MQKKERKTMAKDKTTISIAKHFSMTPGPRYPSEGKYSGEECREVLIYPNYRLAVADDKHLEINLDGTNGYGLSFLDEVFAGLILYHGVKFEEFEQRVTIISTEVPSLLREIRQRMLVAKRQNPADMHKYRVYADGSVLHEDDYDEAEEGSSDDYAEYAIPSELIDHIADAPVPTTRLS